MRRRRLWPGAGRLGCGAFTPPRSPRPPLRAPPPPPRRPAPRPAPCRAVRRRRGAVRPPGLRHVAPSAAALAAELLRSGPDKVDRVEPGGKILGDADHDPGLTVLGHSDDRDHSRAETLLALVGEALEVAHL